MKRPVKKVLIAPLDWGLGHATRCIPVIRELMAMGTDVAISASGGGKILLETTFPACKFIEIPGISIRYPESGSMAFSMLLQAPSILGAIRREHEQLEKVILTHHITHVISDNRFGLYSDKVKSAFITHQVHIKSTPSLKFLEPLLFRMNESRIKKFDEIWIPDSVPPDNLSGDLSDTSGIAIPVKHLGILSRFTKPSSEPVKKYDFIALLSGPEPQRTLLEKKILLYFKSTTGKCLLVSGKPGDEKYPESEYVNRIAAISDEELQNLLHPETTLICRPGYSTLMDLSVLKHLKVLFIPTPGQTEQEYLAHEMRAKYGYACMQQQDNFPMNEVPDGKPLPELKSQEILKKTIGEFLS